MKISDSNLGSYLVAYLEESRKSRERSDKIQEEFNRKWEKDREESNRKWEEFNRKQKEFNRKWWKAHEEIRKITDQTQKLMSDYGGLSDKDGKEIEKIFVDSFKANGLRLGVFKFDKIETNIKPIEEVELDIVLKNTSSIAIVEVKRTLRERDIDKFFQKTMNKLEKLGTDTPSSWKDKQIIPVLCGRLLAKDAEQKLSRHKQECFVITTDDARNLRILHAPKGSD